MTNLTNFLRESFKIEGIMRGPTIEEISATKLFLSKRVLFVSTLELLLATYQPNARLRSASGADVRVGDFIPVRGGPHMGGALATLLVEANERRQTAWVIHRHFEILHPFTDGNGRVGRTLWLWMMGGEAPLGFLHTFYYQTLREAEY